jgi:hypothetical protein
MMRWQMNAHEIKWCAVDAIEVSPVRIVNDRPFDPPAGETTFVEVCSESEADFWSVFTHFRTGGVECVADFDLECEAWDYAETVLAGPRGLPTYSGAR